MSVTVTLRCSEHPHYRAIRPPKAACKVCQGIYEFKRALKAEIPGAYGFTHDAAGSLQYTGADGQTLVHYFHKDG
jgi:hypothetical protein